MPRVSIPPPSTSSVVNRSLGPSTAKGIGSRANILIKKEQQQKEAANPPFGCEDDDDWLFDFSCATTKQKISNDIRIQKPQFKRIKSKVAQAPAAPTEQPPPTNNNNTNNKTITPNNNDKMERAQQPPPKPISCIQTNSSYKNAISANNRAIAVDTRFLYNVSLEIESGGRLFLHETCEFLKLCARRGHLPSFFASCQQHNNIKKNNTISSKATTLPLNLLTGWSCPNTSATTTSTCEEEKTWNHMFSSVAIPLHNTTATKTEDEMTAPIRISAQDSWCLFVNFVTNLVREASLTKVTTSLPLDVSILTSDITLFSDASSDKHVHGLQHFWDSVHHFFDNGDVRSITITIVETGTMRISSISEINKDPSSNKLLVAQSLCNLRHFLDSLHGNNNNPKKGKCPMHISLEVIGCNFIEYGSMLRRWIQKNLHARRSNKTLLIIELPEDTFDGSSCSIRLDLSFKTCPYAIHVMLQLFPTDEKMLVIHVVPNDVVDASLIYGVAMVAEAAIDSDYSTYKEMKSLVTQIFKWLTVHDVSLVLRGTSEKGEGLAQCNTYFLLTAETQQKPQHHLIDNTSTTSNGSSNHINSSRACLFRYATAEQILDDGDRNANHGSRTKNTGHYYDDHEQQQEIDQQYYDYVDRSLQLLDRTPLNPMLLPGVNYQKPKHSRCVPSFSMIQQHSTNQLPTPSNNLTSTSTMCSSSSSSNIQQQTSKVSQEKEATRITVGQQFELVITSSVSPFTPAMGFQTNKHAIKYFSSDDDDEDIPCNYAFDDT